MSVSLANGIRFLGSSLILAYCAEAGISECKIVDFQNIVYTDSVEGPDKDVLFAI